MNGLLVKSGIGRLLGGLCLLLGLASAGPVWGEAADKNNQMLSACATRYGEAEVRHWLVVDLTHQIDRAMIYQPEADPAPLHHLQEGLLDSFERLEQARSLYKKIYNHDVENHATALGELLDAINSLDARNEKTAEDILTGLGQKAVGLSFQAVPRGLEKTGGAWDPKWIGSNFKPKRLLFGSTGKMGDNRILPLGFDFGNGPTGVGPFVAMAAPGQLKLPEGMAERTDAIYPWMKTNHVGYHFWSGIYNNQNTYIAPWFRTENENEEDVWMKLEDGRVLKSSGDWGQVNIWNRRVQDYLRNYAEAQGHTFRNDPFLICYDYTAEPHPYGAEPPGQSQYSGYNDSAVAAFRARLLDKYISVKNINSLWGTSYKSIETINPPPDPYVTPQEKATPLSYEFQTFRCESQTRLWRSIYEAYRRGDPSKPVVANVSQYMNGWPVEGLDAYGMLKAGVADWVDMHMNNFSPNLAEQIYLYSLCRLTGKTPVQFEYVWTFPRTGPVDEDNENDFRTTCEASAWRNLAWGKKALVFFDCYHDWPAYHNALLDRETDYTLLRPSACVIPTVKRRALHLNDVLMDTEVAAPDTIVLQPTASILNGPTLHPRQSFGYHVGLTMHEVHDFLFPRNYPFLYVPEEAVLDDRYELSKHKVILLPEAPYLSPVLTEKLLTWVRNGGTLICYGVPGIWNTAGQDDFDLVTKVFGKTEVKDTVAGKWKWDWKLTEKKPEVQVFTAGSKVIGAMAPYWKGKMLVATENYRPPVLQKLFYDELDKALGQKPYECAKNAFEVVLRQDRDSGRRYLFVLNPSTREARKDEFVIPGNYSQCLDMGIGTGVPMPVAIGHGQTKFSLRLYPGEGTVIALRN